MRSHVFAIVRSCFAALRQVRSVRRSLMRQTPLSLVHALGVSKFDYCNSILAGVSAHLLDRLQSVLNAAARLIFSSRRSEHSLLLRELHWLRVPERIQFRLCVLAFRCLHGTAPSYLTGSLRHAADVDGRRYLRSANTVSLVIPSIWRTTLGCGQSMERPSTYDQGLAIHQQFKTFLFHTTLYWLNDGSQWTELCKVP